MNIRAHLTLSQFLDLQRERERTVNPTEWRRITLILDHAIISNPIHIEGKVVSVDPARFDELEQLQK